MVFFLCVRKQLSNRNLVPIKSFLGTFFKMSGLVSAFSKQFIDFPCSFLDEWEKWEKLESLFISGLPLGNKGKT